MSEMLRVVAWLALLILGVLIFGVGGCTLFAFVVPLPQLGFALGLAWLGLTIYVASRIGKRVRFKKDGEAQ